MAAQLGYSLCVCFLQGQTYIIHFLNQVINDNILINQLIHTHFDAV